jgi:hypothetical protein
MTRFHQDILSLLTRQISIFRLVNLYQTINIHGGSIQYIPIVMMICIQFLKNFKEFGLSRNSATRSEKVTMSETSPIPTSERVIAFVHLQCTVDCLHLSSKQYKSTVKTAISLHRCAVITIVFFRYDD